MTIYISRGQIFRSGNDLRVVLIVALDGTDLGLPLSSPQHYCHQLLKVHLRSPEFRPSIFSSFIARICPALNAIRVSWLIIDIPNYGCRRRCNSLSRSTDIVCQRFGNLLQLCKRHGKHDKQYVPVQRIQWTKVRPVPFWILMIDTMESLAIHISIRVTRTKLND